MQYNIYFRKQNWERFKDEENKSGLINKLLSEHYKGRGGTSIESPIKQKRVPISELKIKGVSVGVCTGDHYMSRVDCGKANCPWGTK